MDKDTLIEWPHVEAVLQSFAEALCKQYKQNLKENDRYTTLGTDTRLIDSVTAFVEAGESAYEVKLTLNDYWKYVEEDTKPHFPPREAILRWVKIKPVIPRPYNGSIPSEEKLADLICWKIASKGTKGTHDLAEARASTIEAFRWQLVEALAEDVEDAAQMIFKFIK